jgi:HAD superfamily hydrolase (TIGR01549 family)
VPIRAVVFDVGEVLVDESHEYGAWADWLGVPRHTFSAVFGAVLARGQDHRRVFEHFRPGFDLDSERRLRADAGLGEYVTADDVYLDARPCLAALMDAGLTVGIAGNQTSRLGRLLVQLLPCDFLATSEDWGVEKPHREFFDRLVSVCDVEPAAVAYIGDRVDNDVVPAAEAGMYAVLLKRGPWAHTQQGHPAADRAHLRLTDLTQLPPAILALNDPAGPAPERVAGEDHDGASR